MDNTSKNLTPFSILEIYRFLSHKTHPSMATVHARRQDVAQRHESAQSHRSLARRGEGGRAQQRGSRCRGRDPWGAHGDPMGFLALKMVPKIG